MSLHLINNCIHAHDSKRAILSSPTIFLILVSDVDLWCQETVMPICRCQFVYGSKKLDGDPFSSSLPLLPPSQTSLTASRTNSYHLTFFIIIVDVGTVRSVVGVDAAGWSCSAIHPQSFAAVSLIIFFVRRRILSALICKKYAAIIRVELQGC